MAMFAHVGRVLFVSVFLLSAWTEFYDIGNFGRERCVVPKKSLYSKLMAQQRRDIFDINVKYIVLFAIVMKVLGSFLFTFDICSYGSTLLMFHQLYFPLTISYDFFNIAYDQQERSQIFVKFIENLALVGALFFFRDMRKSIRMTHKKKIVKAKQN